MKAILKLNSTKKWWKELSSNPADLRIKNIPLIENNLGFLKEIGVKEILVINELTMDIDFINYLNSLQKWGLNIECINSYTVKKLSKYKVEGVDRYISNAHYIFEGIYYFYYQSLMKVKMEVSNFEDEKVRNLKEYLSKNFSQEKELYSTIDLNDQSEQFGANTFLEESSYVCLGSRVGAHTYIDSNSKVIDSYVGDKCYVASNTLLKNCVLLNDVILKSNLRLENSIVTNGKIIKYINNKLVVINDFNLSSQKQNEFKVRFIDRLIAFFLFGISFVLYPLACLLNLLGTKIQMISPNLFLDVVMNKKELVGITSEEMKSHNLSYTGKNSVLSFAQLLENEEISNEEIFHITFYMNFRNNINIYNHMLDVFRKGLFYEQFRKRAS